MSLLGDFLKQVLEREEVQEAAASLLIDFFQPRLPPKDVIEVKAEVLSADAEPSSKKPREPEPPDEPRSPNSS